MADGVKAGTAYIDIDAKLDKFKKDLDRNVKQAGADVEHRLGGAFKKVAAIASTALAAAGVVRFLKDTVVQARESNRVLALTKNVLRSTGGAAHLTAADIGRLSTKLSNLSGVDDELIQQGENVLLTFTKVRNEVGAGNDVFDQATGLALDMSKTLGTDLQGSIIQVGKALNDPIKGVTALQRVGVSFTADQKKLIKSLVDSGDQLGAQKVILKELATEFGGAAKAAATPAERLAVTWGNLKEEIGNKIIPVLDSASTWIADRLPKAFDTGKLGVHAFLDAFKNGDVTSDGFVGVMETIGNKAHDLVVKMQELFDDFKNNRDNVQIMAGALAGVAAALIAIKGAQGAQQIVGGIVQSFSTLLPVLISNPIGAVIALIAAVIGALVVAYFKVKPVHDFFDKVGRVLKGIFEPAVRSVVGWIGRLVDAFHKDGFMGVLALVGSQLETLGGNILGWVTDLASKLPGWAATLAHGLVDWVTTSAIPWLLDHLGQWASSFAGWITGTAIPKLIGWGSQLLHWFLDWLRGAALALPGLLLDFMLRVQLWIFGTLIPNLIAWGLKITGVILGWIIKASIEAPIWLAYLLAKFTVWVFGTAIPKLIEWGAKLGAKLIGWIADEIPKIPGQLWSLFIAIKDWIFDHGIPALVNAGKDLGKGLWDGIVHFFENAPGAALSFGKKIVHSIIQLLNDAIPNSISVPGPFPDIDLPDNPIPNPFHKGGIANQVGRGQEMPATLLGGEGVLQIGTVDAIFRDLAGGGAAAASAAPAGDRPIVVNNYHPVTADQVAAGLAREDRLSYAG